MARIFEILNIRNVQHERELFEDKILSELECNETIKRYLLLCRDTNRKQTEKVKDAPFYNKYSVLEENIEEINRRQKIIDNVLFSDDPCKHLKEYIKQF